MGRRAAAATRYGEQIDSVLVIDSPLRDRVPEESRLATRRRDTPGYRTEAEILARFRAVPTQLGDTALHRTPYRLAVRRARPTGGWVWKFDPEIFGGLRLKKRRQTRRSWRMSSPEFPAG